MEFENEFLAWATAAGIRQVILHEKKDDPFAWHQKIVVYESACVKALKFLLAILHPWQHYPISSIYKLHVAFENMTVYWRVDFVTHNPEAPKKYNIDFCELVLAHTISQACKIQANILADNQNLPFVSTMNDSNNYDSAHSIAQRIQDFLKRHSIQANKIVFNVRFNVEWKLILCWGVKFLESPFCSKLIPCFQEAEDHLEQQIVNGAKELLKIPNVHLLRSSFPLKTWHQYVAEEPFVLFATSLNIMTQNHSSPSAFFRHHYETLTKTSDLYIHMRRMWGDARVLFWGTAQKKNLGHAFADSQKCNVCWKNIGSQYCARCSNLMCTACLQNRFPNLRCAQCIRQCDGCDYFIQYIACNEPTVFQSNKMKVDTYVCKTCHLNLGACCFASHECYAPDISCDLFYWQWLLLQFVPHLIVQNK